MDPWLASYGQVTGQDYASQSSYISARNSSAQRQLPTIVRFAITSNGGKDFMTSDSFVDLEGEAWINIWQIKLNGTTPPQPLSYPSTTPWLANVPLLLGTNTLTFTAHDRQTNILASESITITSTSTSTEGLHDRDEDGLPDEWEERNGLDTSSNGAGHDIDFDGLTNYQEYLAGSDPRDPASLLQINAVAGIGTVTLDFLARAGRSYSIL